MYYLAETRYRTRAAGASWTLVTDNATWAGRYGHATVRDAAGNIYVLGGDGSGTTIYNDVWRSADQGEAAAPLRGAAARRMRACPAVRG